MYSEHVLNELNKIQIQMETDNFQTKQFVLLFYVIYSEHASHMFSSSGLKGMRHGFTWEGPGRLETTKLSHVNATNFI